jgi:hypothetical protein
MKSSLPFKAIYFLLFLAFLSGLIGCKKQSPSANNVRFSFNDSLQATCTVDVRPNFDFIGGTNCEFQFDRIGAFATSESAEIGLFAGYHCDLMTAPLPYQTHLFSVTVIYYKTPADPIAYSFNNGAPPDSTGNTPGNLILTLTQRDNNRVRGNIAGTIYRTNVGQNLLPSQFNCSFDLAIPLVK